MEAFWKILQIKPNNGKLADVPEISVNRFAQDITGEIIDAKAFFLTHCDYDILANLFNSGFLQSLSNSDDSRCLYLHQVAFNFLLYWTTTIFVETETKEEVLPLLQQLVASKKIQFIEKNTPVSVSSKSSDVLVTALSSGHHAGSIMLLIEKLGTEDNTKVDWRILHTGSCRVNLRDIRLLAALHDPDTGKPKKINKLYLDTSFCTKNVTELPARGFVINQLLARTQLKIEMLPELRFEIMDDLVPARSPIVTNAHFLRCLFESSSEPIHVSEDLATFYRSIPNFPELVTTVADADAGSVSHYHCCCGQANDNQFCTGEEGEWAYDFEVNEISLQSNFSSRGSEEALRVFNDERNWKNHGYEKTVYDNGPTSIRAIYCSNLSRYEQARLMNYFDVAPEQVMPLYSSFGTTVKVMRNLLKEACDIVSGKEEPQEIVDDYPSHFYDCTGAPNYKLEFKIAQN